MVLPFVTRSINLNKLTSYSRRPTFTSSDRIWSIRMERPERMERRSRWRRCWWDVKRRMSDLRAGVEAGMTAELEMFQDLGEIEIVLVARSSKHRLDISLHVPNYLRAS